MWLLSFYCAVIGPLFGVVQGWENVRLARCLDNRTVNLFVMSFDNCILYDDYDIEAERYPGVDFSMTVDLLECLLGHDAFRSCASCYLCHYFLHHDQDMFAYKYALRSLEVSPHSAPALSCLAALYLKQGSLVRAAFYSTLAAHYNSTLKIPYKFLDKESISIYDYMKRNHRAVVHPDYSNLIAFLSYVEEKDAAILQLQDIFLNLLRVLNGSERVTLHSAYAAPLSPPLPRRMLGPSILAYEEFLSHFERLLLWYSDVFFRFTGEILPGGAGVADWERERESRSELGEEQEEVMPALQWPQDKTLVLLVQPFFGGHTMTFDENVHGMCDALVRLGVPFRTVTRLLPGDDFVSLQNYGVQANEIMDKNYIYWNFEKNPRIAGEFESPGMTFDSCGNDHAILDLAYVAASVMVWETVPFNLFLWGEDDEESEKGKNGNVTAKVQLVTSPLPDELILRTRAEHSFMDKIADKVPSTVFYSEMDSNRRIDILFYGNSNEHREAMFAEFTELAQQNNLRIEFMMNYNLFGSHRESLIDQAKVVLNLANRAWPRNSTESTAGHGSSQDPQPCAAAINLHRIRSLLARGKVVLSESTGSDIEEEMHEGLLIFAPTSQLTVVALELLRSPEVRWKLESNARRFMLADHFCTTVPQFSVNVPPLSAKTVSAGSAYRLSSLALVAKALQTTADLLWPERIYFPSSQSELKINDFWQLRRDMVVQRYQNIVKELSRSAGNNVGRWAYASYASAWAEMRCQESGGHLTDLLYYNKISTIMYGSIGSRNSSNMCDQRVDLEVLSGYLARRYQYSGNKVLLVGYDDTLVVKIQRAFTVQFQEVVEHVNLEFKCLSPEQFLDYVTPASSFDIIIINQALLKTSYKYLKFLFTHALDCLNTGEGSSILINGMLPAFENHKVDAEWLNKDAYHLLIYMRTLNSFDAALGNFEGGLLVVHPRRNPYRVTPEALEELKFSYADFRKHMDKVIPVLSFAELHDWLSNPMYTKRFVRSLLA